jgi:hypothetical protein
MELSPISRQIAAHQQFLFTGAAAFGPCSKIHQGSKTNLKPKNFRESQNLNMASKVHERNFDQVSIPIIYENKLYPNSEIKIEKKETHQRSNRFDNIDRGTKPYVNP